MNKIEAIKKLWDQKEALLKKGDRKGAMALRRRIRRMGWWQQWEAHVKPQSRKKGAGRPEKKLEDRPWGQARKKREVTK